MRDVLLLKVTGIHTMTGRATAKTTAYTMNSGVRHCGEGLVLALGGAS